MGSTTVAGEHPPPAGEMRIDWFAEQMKHKLELNCHKGGWEDCKNPYLVRRLIEETAELVHAVMRNEDADTVIEKAADVANFCMMIADNRYCR
jgi:NTP pyrophosphatase (non-canonical NTP hydrolase)